MPPKKAVALEAAYRWAVAFLEASADVDPGAQRKRELLDTAISRGNLRGMRLVVRDFEESLSDAPPDVREKILAHVELRCGAAAPAPSRSRATAVEAAVRRKQIVNDREYRAVRHRVEELWEDASASDELRTLNELLAACDGK